MCLAFRICEIVAVTWYLYWILRVSGHFSYVIFLIMYRVVSGGWNVPNSRNYLPSFTGSYNFFLFDPLYEDCGSGVEYNAVFN